MSLPVPLFARRRVAALLIAGVVGGAVAVAVPAGDAGAAGLTCRQSQKFRVKAAVTEYRYSEVYAGGGAPTRTGERRNTWSGGSTDIVATTCRSGSTWRLISPIAMTPSFAGLAVNGDRMVMESGWVRGIGSPLVHWTAKDITLRTFACYKGELFTGLGFVLGIPAPVKTPIAVAAWVVGLLLPEDGMQCVDITRMSVPLSVNRNGYLGLRATTDSGPIYRSSTPLGDIKLVNEWRVVYTAAKL